MADIKIAMISSTVRDLPEHREKARDGCLRQQFMPSMMENWPALDADGVKASLAKVDESEVYIGIFGFRYGYIPKGSGISVTEMEYNRAVERDIPRLIFLMGEKHPLSVSVIDRGPSAEKIDGLRERLKLERSVNFFDSPDDLLAKLVDSLSALKLERAITTSPVQVPLLSFDPRHPVFFVPFRAKGNHVIGRQESLQAVRKQLESGHPTAIGQTASFAGLGGLGKTQLAVEYAYTYRDQYPNGVIWVSADQDIDPQLIEIGQKARWFPVKVDHKDKLTIAKHRLKTYSRVLLILDNLQDPKAITEYLPDPETEIHVLVTSRIEHGSFVPVSLDPLNQELSLKLLIQESGRTLSSPSEAKAADDIAQRLGGLPLALELAGAYLMHRPATTWEKYYDLLAADLHAALPQKFLQSSFTRHEADLYSTLRVNSEIFSEEPLLKDVLDVLTWSGRGSMNVSLLSDLLNIDETQLTNALGLGTALRLLQKLPGTESYLIHQLVRDVRREEVKLDERVPWALGIGQRLAAWFQKHKRNFSDLPKYEAEIEHLMAWLLNIRAYSTKLASRLVWLQAYPPFHRGDYNQSLNLLDNAKRLFDDSGESDPELEGNLFTDLCTICGLLADYDKSKTFGLKAVEIRLQLLGEKHADTAMSINNLGGAFRLLGDYKPALEHAERALKIWEVVQGEKNIDTALALDNIASSHLRLGHRELALEFNKKAYLVREEVLGKMHPDTASSLASLGDSYVQFGKFDEASEYHQRSLNIARELLGECNPFVAFVLWSIGSANFRKQDFRNAQIFFKQSLDIRTELFGSGHPTAIRSGIDYAGALLHSGHVHQGHQILDSLNIPRDHPASSYLKKQRKDLQTRFPRPGFRKKPKR